MQNKKPDLQGKGLAICKSLYGTTTKSGDKIAKPSFNNKQNSNSNFRTVSKGNGAAQKSPPPCPNQKQQ